VISIDSRLSSQLPTRSRLKLARMIQQARDADAAFHSAISARERLMEELGDIKAQQRQAAQRAEAMTGKSEDIAAAVAEYDAAIDQLQGEVDRTTKQIEAREQRARAGAQLIAQLRHALEQIQPGTVLVHAQQLAPRLQNGEDPPKAVARLRAELTKVKTELTALQRSPLPKPELKLKAKSYIAELSKAAVPLLHVQDGLFEVRWQPGVLANGPLGPACAALAAVLDPDALYALLEQQIDEIKGNGLSERERAAKAEQLRSRIADIEAQEESIIEKADEDDWGIVRRTDADAWTVLGIRLAVRQQLLAAE
jgi:chromosome segregation ATPase